MVAQLQRLKRHQPQRITDRHAFASKANAKLNDTFRCPRLREFMSQSLVKEHGQVWRACPLAVRTKFKGAARELREKKRCDLCLGTGIRKCYGCHVAEGWRADNFSTSKCERVGYVPIKVGGFLGIGGKDDEAKCSVCWTDPAKKPGTVQCLRCKGTKYIYFRNADWR